MARKPTLSPSKITTYLACPVKYRWTYIDGRGRLYLHAKSYYSFGSSLHRVLERFHDSEDSGVTTTEEALASLEESWIDAGFASAEEMAEAYDEGKEILERYVAEVKQRPVQAKTLWVEKQLRFDMGEFVLIGRLDRLDEYEDGTLEVVDYKSGRHSVEPDEVATDMAMCCYQLLVKRKFPDRKVQATIVALRTSASATATMTDRDLDDFERDLRTLGIQILNDGDDERMPVFKPLCPNCDFLPLCRKHPDFSEL